MDELTRTPTLPEIDEGMSGATATDAEVTDDIAAVCYRLSQNVGPRFTHIVRAGIW